MAALTDSAARGTAYALLAQLLGEDTTALADDATLAALRGLLEQLGEQEAVARLIDRDRVRDATELSRRRVRWFEHGRIAPYEGSNSARTAGGVTPLLADVAGFYRAFGMQVAHDRPDHVVAELEFMALVSLAESAAHERGDTEGAEICAGAARAFVRDHVGTWLDAWAARLSDVDELRPWTPVAACAAVLVASEARRRNVLPARPAPVLAGDAGIVPDDEFDLVCGAEDGSVAPD